MKEKYYIMPTVKFCYGTEKASSKEEAIHKFMDEIDHDPTRLLTADTVFSKTKPLIRYAPPMNDFEIFMNCAIESLRNKPDRLYCMNGPVHRMNENDINLLMHLQSAYEHARRNEPNMTAMALTYKKAAVASLSVQISEYEIPKIQLVSQDWKEGATTVLTSEDIRFDVYDDGRILCLTKDVDAIRRALKEVDVHVRKI